jgi:hypothetical protein
MYREQRWIAHDLFTDRFAKFGRWYFEYCIFIVGFAMIYFARPKGGEKTTWVTRSAFVSEMYAVTAITLMALGVSLAVGF